MQGANVSHRFSLRPGEASIVIMDEALEVMRRLRQVRPEDPESGGQLFGQFLGADTVISEATPPTLLDRRSRYGFKPNRWLQKREIRARHGRGLHFVGDWHTHPEACPSPSCDDIQSMSDCFRRSVHDLLVFVMIIVGTDPGPGGLYVALVDDQGVRQLRYEPA